MTITDEQREAYYNRQSRVDSYKLVVWSGIVLFCIASWYGIIKFFTWLFQDVVVSQKTIA